MSGDNESEAQNINEVLLHILNKQLLPMNIYRAIEPQALEEMESTKVLTNPLYNLTEM